MGATDRTALIRALPYARRYARALTGGQSRGDAVVADALRGVLAGPQGGLVQDGAARVALYGAIGDRVRAESNTEGEPVAAHADISLTGRMLLLLTALEELPLPVAAAAARLPAEAAATELEAARGQLRAGAAARVLIIEDEPIIALDIQDLVERCGHTVVGVAATEADAVEIARAERPGLVLADVNLGAGGDGPTAVSRILAELDRHEATLPVIFVTAYPERVLTGQALEPAFVITKPFDPMTLAVATYQAVTRGARPI